MSRERLFDLLADRALDGLTRSEELELVGLLAQSSDVDPASFERAAAAVALAAMPADALPAHLAARVEASANGVHVEVAQTRTLPFPQSVHSTPRVAPIARPRGSRAIAISGWLAAAACLALFAGAYVRRPKPPAPIAALAPAEQREKLLATNGSLRADFAKTTDPAATNASGDVVWNEAEQRGFMRFRGLAKNDPHASVYQLWIFDKTRDDRYPVDGGVFDVDRDTSDVVVAIKAKLPVGDPVLFAITVEKPGGVVVSKRERIVATAKLPAG